MLFTKEKITREQTKVHNNRFVLKTVYNKGPISRADIARLTHLTPTTVSGIVNAHIGSGLLEETRTSTQARTRGKPPTLLNFAHQSSFLIGIDLARGEFQGAVMSLDGSEQVRHSVRINGQTGDAALTVLYEIIDALLSQTSGPIIGIGIGAPGILDATHGVVRQAVNVQWQDLPLRLLLRERYNLPVYIANDNHIAVLAEHTFGTYKNNNDLVVLKVGHGIGAGIILNQQIYFGHRFGAGEIGHVAIVENGEKCTCGNYGCLETVASSRAIIKQAKRFAEQNPDSMLHQFVSDIDQMKIQDVAAAFHAKDSEVQQLINQVGNYLGRSVANIVGILSVPTVLIAGSITNFGQPILDIIQNAISTQSLASSVSETQVEFASLGDQVVYLGTTALVLSNELGIV